MRDVQSQKYPRAVKLQRLSETVKRLSETNEWRHSQMHQWSNVNCFEE